MSNDLSELQKLQARNRKLEELLKRYKKKVNSRCKDKIRELEKREELHYALFNHNPVSTVAVDKQGRIIKSNAAKRNAGDRLPNIGDVMYCDYASKHGTDMYRELLSCIRDNETKVFEDMPYDGKYLTITINPFPMGAIITSEDVTARVKAEKDRTKLINELRRALNEVETLRGLLPICASCKSIRDDKGYWSTIEEYFSSRGSVDFSHTLCPECLQMLYPDIYEKMKERKTDPHRDK